MPQDAPPASERPVPSRNELSLQWCYEIEDALVSLLWHEPEHLPKVLQALDPAVHLSQPSARHLLEAVNLCYRQLGDTDFAVVVDCLKDLGTFKAFDNELVGLDYLYSHYGYASLLDYYIERLAEFAWHRKNAPGVFPHRWSGGVAAIAPNPLKRKPTDPDLTGAGFIRGTLFDIRAWVDPSTNQIKLKLEPHK